MKKQLRNKEIRGLKDFIKEDTLKNANKIEKLEDNNGCFILIEEEPIMFEYENEWVYTLKAIIKKININNYKEVIVDKGAIRFVTGGADIMRPGITKIDIAIKEKEIILIKEETHNKPLAIGCSLFSGEEMQEMNSGKVIKNLHYVSDTIWNKE